MVDGDWGLMIGKVQSQVLLCAKVWSESSKDQMEAIRMQHIVVLLEVTLYIRRI